MAADFCMRAPSRRSVASGSIRVARQGARPSSWFGQSFRALGTRRLTVRCPLRSVAARLAKCPGPMNRDCRAPNCLNEPRWRVSAKPRPSRMATTSRDLRTGTLPTFSSRLEKHLDDFLKVSVEFAQTLALTVRPGETRNVAHKEARVGAPLHYRRVRSHVGSVLLGCIELPAPCETDLLQYRNYLLGPQTPPRVVRPTQGASSPGRIRRTKRQKIRTSKTI